MIKVVEAPIANSRDIEVLIARMREAGLTEAVVLGFDKDGEFWSEINFSGGPEALWLLEVAKARLLKAGQE